jgi:uncharacterized membrane protein
MAELLGRFFASIFGTHSGIATMIISMFPLIELKGAIPIGMSRDFWGDYVLLGRYSFGLALLGSSLVCPIVALLFKPFLKFLKSTKIFKKLAKKIERKVKTHSATIDAAVKKEQKIHKTLLKCIFIFLFVSVPLPLTGVWTGTCVAVLIGLNFWQILLSVIAGNCVAGLLIVFVCSVFPDFTTIIFYIMMIIILCILTFGIVRTIVNKVRYKNNSKIMAETKVVESDLSENV